MSCRRVASIFLICYSPLSIYLYIVLFARAGIGQWNAWTRNFNSPLLALLDLFDNSVDAAMKPQKKEQANDDGPDIDDNSVDDYTGKIEVEADWWNRSYSGGDDNDGSDEDYEDIDSAPQETITGIVVTNNSYRQIKALEKILEAYSSAKGREEHGDDLHEGDFAETIGENGVGLKQGCAVLSNLSFVFVVRQGDGDDEASKFSLGVIAKQLQRPEGISLPSIEFVSDDLATLREEMTSLFTGTAVGGCVATYGEGSLDAGVNRLILHFQQMSSRRNGGWGHFGQVFRVVLHDVKGSSASNSNSRALSLMDEINSALPSTYIHLPENVEVKVNGEVIQFNHYQSRLIELTAFYQKIDTNTPVGGDNDWQNPEQGYNVRLLFGFDASRKGGRPKLCIHSRYSGRLVKSLEDCRADLGLTTGSTDFCQGLTVIVDDMFAHLPLNPTKQDIAFGEQGDAGNVHKTNLFSWIGAYTYLFYNIHRNKFGGSKMALSSAIAQQYSQQDALSWDGPSLDSCKLKQYEGIEWKYIKATGNIRCGNLKKVSVSVEGRDTRWRLKRLPEVAQAGSGAISSSSSSPARSNPRPKKKRTVEQINCARNDPGVPVHDLMLPGSSLQAAVRVGLARERSPASVATCTSSGEASTPRSEPPEPDYKKMYEAIVKEHEELHKEHEGLKKRHRDLDTKYQEKRDYKKIAKEYVEKSEQLVKLLDIERRRRREELEEKEEDLREKDGIIERLKKKSMRLEERIKSLDSICSPQRNVQAGAGTRQVSL